MTYTINMHTVPDPSVTLMGQSQPLLYAGFSNQTFTCQVFLDDNVDTDVQITFTWSRTFYNGIISTSRNSVILNGSSTVETSSLTVVDLSSKDDTISCNATVMPIRQLYLIVSEEVAQSTQLTVAGE